MSLPAWLDDVGSYLQTSGIGTLGTDMFYNYFDATVQNCIVLSGQAGQSADTSGGELHKPGLSILVRNTLDSTAESKARAIYNLLNLKVNTVIGSTHLKRIEAVAAPFFVSNSANNLYVYSINFEVHINGA